MLYIYIFPIKPPFFRHMKPPWISRLLHCDPSQKSVRRQTDPGRQIWLALQDLTREKWSEYHVFKWSEYHVFSRWYFVGFYNEYAIICKQLDRLIYMLIGCLQFDWTLGIYIPANNHQIIRHMVIFSMTSLAHIFLRVKWWDEMRWNQSSRIPNVRGNQPKDGFIEGLQKPYSFIFIYILFVYVHYIHIVICPDGIACFSKKNKAHHHESRPNWTDEPPIFLDHSVPCLP